MAFLNSRRFKLSQTILKNYEKNYGDEVHQILRAKPDWFTRNGIFFIAFFALFVLAATIIIKYPESKAFEGRVYQAPGNAMAAKSMPANQLFLTIIPDKGQGIPMQHDKDDKVFLILKKHPAVKYLVSVVKIAGDKPGNFYSIVQLQGKAGLTDLQGGSQVEVEVISYKSNILNKIARDFRLL
jgi:hypothetical protein